MKNKLIFTLIAVLLLTSCTTGKVIHEDKVKVGVSLSFTGPGATVSEWAMNGINLAIDNLPKEEQSKIELIIEDDKLNPTTGLSVAKKLAEIDNVKFIMGPLSSAVAVPTMDYYDEQKIVRMQVGYGVSNTIVMGEYRFFLLGKVETSMKALAEYAYENGFKSVSILYFDDEYGKDNLNWFEHYYEGEIPIMESFDRSDSDFRTQLLKIKETNPDAILLISYSSQLINAMKQMKELGIDTQKLSLINTEDSEVVQQAADLAEGILYPTVIDTSESKMKTWFTKQYQKQFNKPHEAVAVSAFDSFNILWSAIKKCDEDVDCVKQEIEQTKNYIGASGIVSVDDQGVGVRNPAIKTVKDGEFVYVS